MFDESVEGVEIEPVAGQEKFLILSHAHVCYSTTEPGEPLRNLSARARLATSTRVFRLNGTLAGLAENDWTGLGGPP